MNERTMVVCPRFADARVESDDQNIGRCASSTKSSFRRGPLCGLELCELHDRMSSSNSSFMSKHGVVRNNE